MRDILNDPEEAATPDPMRTAQQAMRTPLPKRFYKDVDVSESEAGWQVLLDGRPLRTPGRAVIVLPTRTAAEMVAREYAAQQEVIDPRLMPATRLVNTAIDGVATDPQAVLEDILRFAGTDLLCYRADAPERLIARQAELWDPVLDWARSELGARFFLSEGIVHVTQPRETISALGMYLRTRATPLRLAALHVMTSLTGSALLAIAVDAGELKVDEAWEVAHVDEDWNIAQWGEDIEAAQRRRIRGEEMRAAAELIAAIGE